MKEFLPLTEKKSHESSSIEGCSTDNINFKKLHPYQQKGVSWLINLHVRSKGGILADDMGLGKTVQAAVFLHYLFTQNKIKSCLLVLPKSIMGNWVCELEAWCPGIEIQLFKSEDTSRKTKLHTIQLKGGILISTYGMIQNNYTTLSRTKNNEEFIWDILIIDEAQKIKNTCLTSKNIRLVSTRFRLALSGTPLQNNLMELWNLVNFISFGRLLGPKKLFKSKYADVIEMGMKKSVSNSISESTRRKMSTVIEIVSPFILRRTKKDQAMSLREGGNSIPTKYEFVVWVTLSTFQLYVYKNFMNSPQFLQALNELLNKKRSKALIQITIMRLLSNHPVLVTNWKVMKDILSIAEHEWQKKNKRLNENYFQKSSKITLLIRLYKRLISEGCKILTFSQSRSMLDIISLMLKKLNVKHVKLDGRILSVDERKKIVDSFQTDPSILVFLITTQTGGVGLNITAANRVIIIEPSWNPGSDHQAIDRACRIGQKREVIVYRLVTCGTVEEKIYRRQIFKSGLVKFAISDEKNPKRYFSNEELSDLMTFTETDSSETCKMISDVHGPIRKFEKEVSNLYADGACGVSDHSILFSVSEIDNIGTGEDNPFDCENNDHLMTGTDEFVHEPTVRNATNNKLTSELNIDKIFSDKHLIESNDDFIISSESELESYCEDLDTIEDSDNGDEDSSISVSCNHKLRAKEMGFVVTKCHCNASPSEILQYEQYIIEGRSNSHEPESSLTKFLDALDILDDDITIQIETRLAACYLGLDEDPDILPDYLEV